VFIYKYTLLFVQPWTILSFRNKFFLFGVKIGMIRGIAWAMGFVGGDTYDKPTIAADMARTAGIHNKKELREAGVDEYDIAQIGEVLPEIEEDKAVFQAIYEADDKHQKDHA